MKQVHLIFNLVLLAVAAIGGFLWITAHIGPLTAEDTGVSMQYVLLTAALLGSLQLSFSSLYYQGTMQYRLILFFFQWGMLCWVAGMMLWITGSYSLGGESAVSAVSDYVFNFAPVCWLMGAYYWVHLLPHPSQNGAYSSRHVYAVPVLVSSFGASALYFFASQGTGALIDEPVLTFFSIITSSCTLLAGMVLWWATRSDRDISRPQKWNQVLIFVGALLYFFADLQELASRAAYQVYDGSLSDMTFLVAIVILSIAMAQIKDPFDRPNAVPKLTTAEVISSLTCRNDK